MTPARGIAEVLIGIAILLLPRGASAHAYDPLGQGFRWEYRSLSNAHDTETIVGTTALWGHEVYVRLFTESTDNEGLENYVSNDPSGGALLWGWKIAPDCGVFYNPPILMVEGAPALDDEWSDTTAVYFLPDTTVNEILIYARRVFTDEDLSLPIGGLRAFGVGFSEVIWPERLRGRDVGGRWGEARDGAADRWYSAEIGLVQRWSSDIYQLVHYEQPSTAIESVTWGSLKFRWSGNLLNQRARLSRRWALESEAEPLQPIRLP
jgi:hypothetical protein